MVSKLEVSDVMVAVDNIDKLSAAEPESPKPAGQTTVRTCQQASGW